MTLPTDPQAIAEHCWNEAMAWLFREAYIVRPEVSELRELYTVLVNGTESGDDIKNRVGVLVCSVYSSPAPGFRVVNDLTAVGMLAVIARGKPSPAPEEPSAEAE